MKRRTASAITLYDHLNRPLRATAYDASGGGRRAANWWPSGESINAIFEGTADTLRTRSRDQVRRNPWLSSAKDTYVSNVIGTGILPVTPLKPLRAIWDDWVDESDADGLSDFYGQQTLAVGQMFEAGECFARMRPRRLEDGLTVPMQVQLLETDFLRSTMNENLNGGRGRIRQGIEFDAIGRRVAYHFYREHPGERFRVSGIETTRVPASEVIQLFEPLRPAQLRGLPKTAAALALLYTIDQSDDARLKRDLVAALFAFFFTKTADPSFGAEDDADDDLSKIDSIEPGTGYQLLPGEEVKFSEVPSQGSYVDFMRYQLRKLAGALDLTYEQLTGDMTGVNYSSARVALLEVRRRHEQIQHHVVAFRFCRPIWRRFVADAVLSGAFELPDGVTLSQAQRVKWMPQGWQWVDPMKEVAAETAAIRAGLTSRTAAVAARGFDAEEIDAEQALDNARADDFGLPYESDARRDAPVAVAQANASAKQDEQTGQEETSDAASQAA